MHKLKRRKLVKTKKSEIYQKIRKNTGDNQKRILKIWKTKFGNWLVANKNFSCGDQNQVTAVWATVVQRRDPRIRLHPMCRRGNWSSLAIPISLHGDAVPAVGVGKKDQTIILLLHLD